MLYCLSPLHSPTLVRTVFFDNLNIIPESQQIFAIDIIAIYQSRAERNWFPSWRLITVTVDFVHCFVFAYLIQCSLFKITSNFHSVICTGQLISSGRRYNSSTSILFKRTIIYVIIQVNSLLSRLSSQFSPVWELSCSRSPTNIFIEISHSLPHIQCTDIPTTDRWTVRRRRIYFCSTIRSYVNKSSGHLISPFPSTWLGRHSVVPDSIGIAIERNRPRGQTHTRSLIWGGPAHADEAMMWDQEPFHYNPIRWQYNSKSK